MAETDPDESDEADGDGEAPAAAAGHRRRRGEAPPPPENPGLEALLEYLKHSRGFDFTPYKRPSLGRRIDKRMEAVAVAPGDYDGYVDYLEVHPEEFTHLFNTILINVTAFFRDPTAWDGLREQVLPRLLESKQAGEAIRVWSAGCASGEEPYTLAILLNEALGLEQALRRVKIFATDADDDALNQARHATYTARDVAHVPPELMARYFEAAGDKYVFHKDLRRAVIFGRHDLLQDAPISRVDLVTCRNVLMYFNTESQAKILDRFHFALNEGGHLFLGKAEMLFGRPANFAPLDVKRRLFVKVGKGAMRERLLSLAQGGHIGIAAAAAAAHPGAPEAKLREAAFDIDPIAQVVVDGDNCVTLANESARELFGLTRGDLGRPVQDLRLSYQPVELRSLIERVRTDRRPVVLKDVTFPGRDGAPRTFDVQVVALAEANTGTLLGVKAVYADVTRFKQLQEELEHSHQELETAYEELQSSNEEKETANEELQSTVEELETANEELQSTVEELETTNEELQSTNEELETMNEELQSTNEELQTINEELRDRSADLNRVNSFLSSILSSLRSGVIVVDRELKVLAWNERSEDLWGLRDDEVAGRHLMGLDIGLPLERLKGPIRRCLAGDGPRADGEATLEATNRRGKAIQCRASCSPLLDEAEAVRGVIILVEENGKAAPGAVGDGKAG